MNLTRFTSILALVVLLAACGGHGYEGRYESKVESSVAFVDMAASHLNSQKYEIGSDYIETQGQRMKFDIFVRKSGEDRYLVFKDKKSEEAWKIVDKNTLTRDMGAMQVKLVRIK